MKLELSHAIVALVGPAGPWWGTLSPLKKALATLTTVALAAGSIGAGIGVWGAQALDVPARLTAVEVELGTVQAEHAILGEEHVSIRAFREENTCMLKRLMCRMDGDTPNRCDLRFTVRAGKCPGG